MATEIELTFDKARRSLALARDILERGDYDFAASRAYYAAFYAVRAVLRSREISTSKHSGAISEFGRLFVKTRIFPREFGKSFQRLFEDRQRGDYEPGMSVSARNAGQDIAEAEKIVTAIGAYLRENGHLAAQRMPPGPPEPDSE